MHPAAHMVLPPRVQLLDKDFKSQLQFWKATAANNDFFFRRNLICSFTFKTEQNSNKATCVPKREVHLLHSFRSGWPLWNKCEKGQTKYEKENLPLFSVGEDTILTLFFLELNLRPMKCPSVRWSGFVSLNWFVSPWFSLFQSDPNSPAKVRSCEKESFLFFGAEVFLSAHFLLGVREQFKLSLLLVLEFAVKRHELPLLFCEAKLMFGFADCAQLKSNFLYPCASESCLVSTWTSLSTSFPLGLKHAPKSILNLFKGLKKPEKDSDFGVSIFGVSNVNIFPGTKSCFEDEAIVSIRIEF